MSRSTATPREGCARVRYTFDSREVRPGMGFVALKGEKADGHAFIPQALERGAAEIVDGLAALQEKARERRRSLKAKVVGLTGSAGKTTTKELLRAFLSTVGRTYATEGNFNNHIGPPQRAILKSKPNRKDSQNGRSIL